MHPIFQITPRKRIVNDSENIIISNSNYIGRKKCQETHITLLYSFQIPQILNPSFAPLPFIKLYDSFHLRIFNFLCESDKMCFLVYDRTNLFFQPLFGARKSSIKFKFRFLRLSFSSTIQTVRVYSFINGKHVLDI